MRPASKVLVAIHRLRLSQGPAYKITAEYLGTMVSKSPSTVRRLIKELVMSDLVFHTTGKHGDYNLTREGIEVVNHLLHEVE